jgi:FtsH-binding integral membrane protein
MKESLAKVYLKTYWWMSTGLVLSGAVALWISQMNYVQAIFDVRRWLIAIIVFIEILLIVWLMRRFNDMTVSMMNTSYFLFAALNGVVLSLICSVYEIGTIYIAFFITAGMFVIMAILSYFAKIPVTHIYSGVLLALIGALLLTFTGLFVDIGQINYTVSSIMILIFTLLTIYNIQPIAEDCSEDAHKLQRSCDCGLRGALRMYLSWIYAPLTVLLRISQKR